MEDVAARAGVSRALVSLALKDSPRVADASKAAILAAANALGYRPNLAARNLASHRTATIGVLLNDLHNPFFAEVFDGLAAAAEEIDLKLLLTTGRRIHSGERSAIDAMIEHRVEGMVLVGTLLPSAEVAKVARSIPTVVVGRSIRDTRVDCVTNHDADGARIAVEHLVALGHRSIVHIDGGAGAGAASRRAGFLKAIAMFDAAHGEVISGDFTERAGVDGARKMLRQRRHPTAVFGANDLVAIGALDAIVQSGLSIPEDISVVGYDNSPVARLSRISLTSIDQSTERLGRVAIELLQTRIGGRGEQRIELVTPTLMIRRTTATLSGANLTG
jgi:DNA-binding LacI/PurR family transcriptional regulator